MNINIALLVVIASLALANSANAANKTGVTDSLNAGDSRLDLNYALSGASSSGTISTGATTISTSAKLSTMQFGASYLVGVTNRFNIGVALTMSLNSNTEYSDTGSPNILYASKAEGEGDPSVLVKYLLVDKKDGNMGLLVYGSYSPASAASEDGVTEVKTNGVVTTAGKAGKPGRGYPTSSVGLTYSTPIAIGNIFTDVNYTLDGEKTVQGVTSKNGAKVLLALGIESKFSDTATLSPYIYVVSVGSGYSGTDQSTPYNSYGLGLTANKDVTKHISIGITGRYYSGSNHDTNYASGTKATSSLTGYALSLSGILFF